MLRSMVFILLTVSVACGPFEPLAAQQESAIRTGKAREKAMSTQVNWSVSNSPVQDQLRLLSEQTQTVIVLDRRIDPGFPLSLDTGFVPRWQVVQKISAAIPSAGAVDVADMTLVGPYQSVRRIPVLMAVCDDTLPRWKKSLSNDEYRKVTQVSAREWPMLAEPRQLLVDAARAAGVTIRNPEAVPHDLWDEGRLTRLSFLDFSCVVLAQFDLQPVLDESKATISLEPVDATAKITHKYSITAADKPRVAQAWQALHPDLALRWTGNSTTITASVDQHADMMEILSFLNRPATSADSGGSQESLRTRKFQLKASRTTVADLIQFFANNSVRIEIANPESPEAKALLRKLVDLGSLTEKMPGREFFPALFGDHVREVNVQDDRVILTP
ncbi:MAG: hypothetical protein JNM43_07860 [Planctomycetaceae bacterium]|nr:hypothetical protein [Planctomycetaceae bacterium]